MPSWSDGVWPETRRHGRIWSRPIPAESTISAIASPVSRRDAAKRPPEAVTGFTRSRGPAGPAGDGVRRDRTGIERTGRHGKIPHQPRTRRAGKDPKADDDRAGRGSKRIRELLWRKT